MPPDVPPPAPPENQYVRVLPIGAPLKLHAGVAARPTEGARKVAVLVAHGMGSQVPFQTLQDVAHRLLPYAAPHAPNALPVEVDLVNLDGTQLPRAALTIRDKQKALVDVHFFEAYWAPLTEGKVTARDGMWFLFMAGLRGILGLRFRGFRRWMFDGWQSFNVSRSKLALYFLTALLTIGAVVVMNLAIAGVAASQSLTSGASKWPSKALLADLTSMLAFFECRTILFLGVGLGLPMALRWAWMKYVKKPFSLAAPFRWFLRLCFALTLFLTIHTGWLVLRRLVLDWAKGQDAALGRIPASTPGWMASLLQDAIRLFTWLWAVAGSATNWARPELRWLFGGVRFTNSPAAVPLFNLLIVWALAVGAAYVVRWFLRQFIGDVAAYVSSYSLSKFDDLRNQIQKVCLDVFGAVYHERNEQDTGFEYEEIVVVGHSLGSVIAYDTVNALLNQKPSPPPNCNAPGPPKPQHPLEVPCRTKTLLTFGSPLDKTAYVFRCQRPEENEIREALAAAKQPMILDYDYRPKSWVNLYSRDDWFSGSLEFYDVAKQKHPWYRLLWAKLTGKPLPKLPAPPGGNQRVRNCKDPEACIPLIGHTYYWKSEKFASELYKAVIAKP